MSRVTRWKVEKTKLKVVFRLQFHATHIPQPGWDKLFISFVPADSGKVTAKTTKANVRTGACKWGDPIYETTRLLQDIKTKQYDDKFYKLVIAMGSSRSSVLGEANINLAHYADASKPSAVQLPLQGCDSGTILHVTIQLLSSKTGFREFELQREMREKGLHSTSDEPTAKRMSSFEASINDPMDKANTRGRLKELSPLEEVGVNEEYADSAGGFDGSSTASESFCVEKQDTSSPHEIDSIKSMTSGDLVGPSVAQSPQQEKVDHSDPRFLPLGSNDWSHGWGSDYSADNDLANVYEENNRLRRSLETAESSILELKLEVNSLRCHSDEIGIEAQRFSQKLATELASGERLASEVSVLRSECANVKADLERLKDSKLNTPFSTRETVATTGHDAFLQELQLRWLKGLRDLEDKVKVIQSKASFGLHEKDLSSFNSDLETLRAVLRDLKQGNGRSVSGLNLVKDVREINLLKADPSTPRARFNSEFYQPGALLHSLDIPSLVPQESDSANDQSAMKEFALVKEVDELKAEREALTRKMDQMECYYEALVQELEESQRQMVGELQNLRNEHSTCLYTISATKAEMENIHQEMNKQLVRFSEEKCEFDSLCQDLERRAVAAEAALKRARLNYSIAVNQLQKDLELLSVQVLSMHETSENLIKQAFSDSPPASVLGYEEGTENKKLDAKEFQATKRTRPQSQFDGVKKQQLGGEIVSEDLKRSLLLQKGLYQKFEEEVYEVHLVNVYLDIFSKTLQESLLEASADFRLLKEKVAELTQDLEISTEAKELLMQRLRDAVDEVHQLRGYKDACDAKCNDLALQNHVLDLKVQTLTRDKISLSQKIAECETVIEELGNYKSKFQTCSMEKLELEDLLKKEMLENGDHRSKTASLQEEMIALSSQFDEVVSVKENLHSTVNCLQSKLQNLLVDYDDQCSGLSIWTENVDRGLGTEDLAGVVTRLEEFHRSSGDKILQLTGEKQALAQERDLLQMSLSTAEADNLSTRHKFEENLRNIIDKLDASGNLVQKLQAEVEVLANKLKISSAAEETYEQQNRALLSAFDQLEVELRQLTSKNEGLSWEIRALESTSGELGSLKLVITDLTEAKDTLTLTLRDRDEECAKLNVELVCIRSSLQSLLAELEVEKSIKSKLEDEVTDLTSQLSNKHSELLNFEKQKSELVHLRQLVAELEHEKSTIFRTLSDSENSLKAAREECSSIFSLEEQISEMLEYSMASDVRHICTQTQLELHIEELQKKYLCVESKLNSCLATEAHYIEENAKLMADLRLLRSDFDASIAQNKVQLDTNSGLRIDLDELKKCAESTEATSLANTRKHALEVGRLEVMKMKYEDEIDNLIVIMEDLEVKLIVLKFKVDSFAAQNGVLFDANLGLRTELDEYKKRTECLEATSDETSRKCALEVARLEDMVVKYGEEIDDLALVNEEQEIKLLVLKFKLEEQKPQIALLEDHKRDLMMLQNKYDEITRKLSEQVLKTEEFKNLLIHLKEVKDKADAESLQAREKGDEGAPPAVHESLRMVFIKEQCETKVQELQQHLSVSKRHSEEMLWKLQDAVDEVDNRKKSEASNLKRNEELGIRISELESDLQSIISEKRELMKAYDLMKAEKECSSISLECCKEEKLELEASLQKCNEEKSKLSVELLLLKDFLESSKSAAINQRDSGDADHADSISDESLNRSLSEPISVSGDTNDCEEAEADFLSPINEADLSNALVTVPQKQDTFGSVNSSSRGVQSSQEDVLNGDTKHLSLVNDHFRGQSLRSSMDHLNKELEKMKYDSLLISEDDHQVDPCLPGLQRELMQLNKVNEELGCIFPSFKEFHTKGNALERVLALEIELAEALQEKKKSSLHFQSSFLKQHNDEEAVFKSFRDINELIGDMLEIKGRYSAVESELKEMHGRYSELSLQFAEVEGERQKLMMTLKTVRASRKVSFSNRNSPAPRGGPM